MTVEAVRDQLHAIRMELTRHLSAALQAQDPAWTRQVIATRRQVIAQIERLLLAELTASLAEVQTCVDALAQATKDLVAVEARSDQITKVIHIAATVVAIAAKLATK